MKHPDHLENFHNYFLLKRQSEPGYPGPQKVQDSQFVVRCDSLPDCDAVGEEHRLGANQSTINQ